MKVNKKSNGSKNSKKVKKDINRNKKNNKQKLNEDDSDISDIEAEYFDDIPSDIAVNVRRLLREDDDDEHEEFDVDPGLEFLKDDPLIDSSISHIGFLPDDKNIVDTTFLWNKLKATTESQFVEDTNLIKIKSVYNEVGIYLSRYKSGGLPKAFKVLPKMKNWMTLLECTVPDNWTPNAMSEITHLFASNMNEATVEIFYTTILLPSIRKDLTNKRTLNYHYYMALKKAMFKPSAWFKGILLPLVQEGCTYREASIIGSILKKLSIPRLHVGAFIIKICKCTKWFGSTSFILSILLQKKIKFPNKVISECVGYFCRFEDYNDQLPVIWHQSLYVFVLNYKGYLSRMEVDSLERLSSNHKHPQITPLIMKELSCTVNDVVIYM